MVRGLQQVCAVGLVSWRRQLRREEDPIAVFSCQMRGHVEKMKPGSSLRCTGRG